MQRTQSIQLRVDCWVGKWWQMEPVVEENTGWLKGQNVDVEARVAVHSALDVHSCFVSSFRSTLCGGLACAACVLWYSAVSCNSHLHSASYWLLVWGCVFTLLACNNISLPLWELSSVSTDWTAV
jgi:hypothetical protein